jgi:uncharacterized protein
MIDQSILWRRLDRPGHEFSRLIRQDSFWQLSGTAVFSHDGMPSRLDYMIVCDSEWQTVSARVDGLLGGETIAILIEVDNDRVWWLNGTGRSEVEGCTDIDLNFSPSTNLLPIRRLDLALGEQASVRAAWLRFPGFTLEPLEQVYHRVDQTKYRYESAGGSFRAILEVNEAGFVTHYPNFCETDADYFGR